MARAGSMRDRVTFQRMASTVDAYGNTTGNWSDHLTRSGELVERVGQQRTEQGVLTDVAIARLKIRKDTSTNALTIADRVLARNTTWSIRSISQVDAQGSILEMVLEKGVAA